MIARAPVAALRPLVERIWATGPVPVRDMGPSRERVLPSGAGHLVFRPGGEALRLYATAETREATKVASAMLAGPRATPYVRDTSRTGPSVGAMIRPGAFATLLGVPASALAHQHVDAELVLGPWARALGERLAEAPTAAAQLACLEQALLARAAPSVPPGVRFALGQLEAGAPIADIAGALGISHRQLDRLFLVHVGLAPRRFAQVRRFGSALDRLARGDVASLADLAVAVGFADQPHLTRAFRGHAELTPGAYARARPVSARHVAIAR